MQKWWTNQRVFFDQIAIIAEELNPFRSAVIRGGVNYQGEPSGHYADGALVESGHLWDWKIWAVSPRPVRWYGWHNRVAGLECFQAVKRAICSVFVGRYTRWRYVDPNEHGLDSGWKKRLHDRWLFVRYRRSVEHYDHRNLLLAQYMELQLPGESPRGTAL